MRPIFNYDIVMYDCDGVILDSNQMKVDAMRSALAQVGGVSRGEMEKCIEYFRLNFGQSRRLHIEYFSRQILSDVAENFEHRLNMVYSENCKVGYPRASFTPHILDLLSNVKVPQYVVSGSDEEELRDVFLKRGISSIFCKVFGSPTKKTEHIRRILSENSSSEAVLVGDSASDLESAKSNGIDFIFYSPLSMDKARVRGLCLRFGYREITSFEELL